MHQVYLGLGSNQGDREALMRSAIRLIGERVGRVVRQSSMIETEPWGFESVNKFLNAAILCQTDKSPREVLTVTQQIERELGRRKKTPAAQRPTPNVQRSTFNVQRSTYTDRPIDIDILLYDDLCIDEPDLKIPHPLMQERDFVMIPLHEISD
jgi:2-amino-4-hydroxy-6-hydroxymethyldihydropteridine diphosphokinase